MIGNTGRRGAAASWPQSRAEVSAAPRNVQSSSSSTSRTDGKGGGGNIRPLVENNHHFEATESNTQSCIHPVGVGGQERKEAIIIIERGEDCATQDQSPKEKLLMTLEELDESFNETLDD